MTTRQISPTRTALDGVFPEFPPRDDMLNPLYLHAPAHQAALARHFGSPETTLVLCEVPVNWQPSANRREVLIPDLTVAFDIDTEQVIRRNGYSISAIGKPPDFVLEVASPSTGVRDYTHKRNRYAEFGIPEYWRFDHTGGEYHDAALAGDRLGARGYAPIPIETIGDGIHRGHSDVLGLDIYWQHGQLRFYDTAKDRWLMTFDEEADARQAHEDARQALEVENRRLREELERIQSNGEQR